MEAIFATKFEDVWHKQSLILSPSLTYLDDLKQSEFTDD